MISLRDVTRTYQLPKLRVEVLKGINLDIARGDFVAIMGPSGSGKSTLMNIIGCLDRPSSGQYLLNNMDVSVRTDNELAGIRNAFIGFVFQSFNLLPRYTARKNVELPLVYSGLPPKERAVRAAELLEKVGLKDRLEHKPNELSGGEQQRVAIARALVTRPAVLLADEPTGNLDSRSGSEIMEIFTALNREEVTIIMVTHEREIAAIAGRTVMMRDGQCVSGA